MSLSATPRNLHHLRKLDKVTTFHGAKLQNTYVLLYKDFCYVEVIKYWVSGALFLQLILEI